eukprot:772939-Pelagomonas_calceolata.AAC.3
MNGDSRHLIEEDKGGHGKQREAKLQDQPAEFEKCLDLIDKVLEENNNSCEYALHVKALIKRQQGSIHESLELFQQATSLNPHNVANLKQVMILEG